MRLAAIDVGSNSIHMVIADLGPRGHFEMVDRVKEMVRLGRHSFSTGRLSSSAMDLAVRTLGNIEQLTRIRRVDRLRAVATSAVREANNREAFLRRVRRKTGLQLEVISGTQEARLIYLAARYALGLDGGPHLLLDVGGGSVELVLVHDGRPLWLRSLPLGAARMTERFLGSEPPSHATIKQLERHLEQQFGDLPDKARRAGVVRVIGTSGTVNTLVAMARAAQGEELGRLHGASASRREITRLRNALIETDSEARLKLPGIDAKRADLLTAAVILTDFVLRRCDAPELVACSWALREGLLVEMAGVHAANGPLSMRWRSVEALASRFAGRNEHGRHVARLASRLFDGVGPALRLPERSREWLEYAALLHDIGHAIDHDRHNRHSYYLIRNAELFGFNPEEIEMIALVARGHRKQAAKLESPEMSALAPAKRRLIRPLVAILRIADAIDRSHLGMIRDLAVSESPTRIAIGLDAGEGNADLELWECERRTDLLARLLERRVIVHRKTGSAGVKQGARA